MTGRDKGRILRLWIRATLAGILAGWLVVLALVLVLHGAALACARASDGADGSIAACYEDRGLSVPADL